jgi:hypothetical protein
MARYAVVNGDRITSIVEWDGRNKMQWGDADLKPIPDGIGSEWVGKSFEAAKKAGDTDKKGTVLPGKDEKDGLRAEQIKPAEGGLHNSGEVFNAPETVTIAAEHPLDPVLGSEMRTEPPNMYVAVVPASQPKTDAQAAKDAGFETPADRANAKVAAQEKMASKVRPPASRAISETKAKRRPA